MAAYTLRQLFVAYEGWREINIHDKWEQTRVMCYWMGNHKVMKPDELFPLEIDNIRMKNLIDSGKANFARVRKQTPEEQELIKRLSRGR